MSARRPPSVQGIFVPALHGLRGWAVAIVVLFHVTLAANYIPHGALPRGLVEGGYLALDALFFTSGFVLFLPVVASGSLGGVRAFLVRRFARMGPPYYLCLLVILIAYPLLATQAVMADNENTPANYLIHLAFLQREVSPSSVGLGVNGPVWALSIDFIFYLVLPLVAAAYLRRPLMGLGVAFGISLAWRLLVDDPVTDPDWLIQFPLFVVDFGAGMTAAWAYLKLREPGSRRPGGPVTLALAGACLLVLVGLVWLAGHTVPFHAGVFQGSDVASMAFPLVLGVLVVAAALSPAPAQWPLTNAAILWFSEISYSFFLYHVLVMSFGIATLGTPTDGNPRAVLIVAVVTLPITLVLSILSYRFVELPSRRWGRAVARRLSRDSELGTAGARAAALGGVRAE